MKIPDKAVDVAQSAGDSFGLELASYDIEKLLDAAAPIIAAQALRDAAETWHHESITSQALNARAASIEGAQP